MAGETGKSVGKKGKGGPETEPIDPGPETEPTDDPAIVPIIGKRLTRIETIDAYIARWVKRHKPELEKIRRQGM